MQNIGGSCRQWISPPASGRMRQSFRRTSRKSLRLTAMGAKPGSARWQPCLKKGCSPRIPRIHEFSPLLCKDACRSCMLSLADGGLNRYCGEPNLDQMAPGKAMALLAAARARFVTVNASSQRFRHRENARADDTINDVRCQAPASRRCTVGPHRVGSCAECSVASAPSDSANSSKEPQLFLNSQGFVALV
jgi:hypothetical protein